MMDARYEFDGAPFAQRAPSARLCNTSAGVVAISPVSSLFGNGEDAA